MHTLDLPQPETSEKPKPALRMFLKVGNLPYEFDEYDVVSVVSDLIHKGVSEITVRRFIVDDNQESAAPETPEVAVDPVTGAPLQ
jgi:hypothetical protein